MNIDMLITTAYVGYCGAQRMRHWCETDFAGVADPVALAREAEADMRDHLRRTITDAGEAEGMAALGGIRYAAIMEELTQ